MHIGIDAGALSIYDERLQVGVFHITRNLIDQIARFDTNNKFTLYGFNEAVEKNLINLHSNVEIRTLSPSVGFTKIRLPLELLVRKVDVFLGLSQFIPLTSIPSVGFIYDLGFIKHPQMYPDSAVRLRSQTIKLIERSKRIVTISKASRDDICAHFNVDQSKIHVLYLGVSDEFSKIGDYVKHDKPYFVFVGSLKRQKNIPFLLRAFKKFLHVSKKILIFL